ncbi:hypothetical protein [Hyphomonas sp.]|uniref:hypothetical protein n=1 Tax=Hyphomonas sp. TaxID=87 RepID=UPI0030FBED4F
MTTSLTIGRLSAALVSAGIVLALTGCASLNGPSANVDAAETQSMTIAGKDVTRSECEAQHASMMAKMAEGGMMQGDGMMQDGGMAAGHMMSPEMKAQHQACMDMFPEMKAEMRTQCEAHMTSGMSHGMQGDGMMDHDAMRETCPMMKSENNDDGGQQ